MTLNIYCTKTKTLTSLHRCEDSFEIMSAVSVQSACTAKFISHTDEPNDLNI